MIINRPALPSIAYRVGRWATFDASMLAALSDPAFPALAQLRTRDTSDFSIALLDAWAVTLDILTFYQERFANEAFLGTAVDQRSVFELAALVGYQPSPGVAASAALAFTLSSAPGSPGTVLIPAGTRVQSVPGPGQTAQVFETSSDLKAQIGWNALPAQTTIAWQLAPTDTSTWIAGTANNINVGDALLFVGPAPRPRACRFRLRDGGDVQPDRTPPTGGNDPDCLGSRAVRSLLPAAPWTARHHPLQVRQQSGAVRRPGTEPADAVGRQHRQRPGYPRAPSSEWNYRPTGRQRPDQPRRLLPRSGAASRRAAPVGRPHRNTTATRNLGVRDHGGSRHQPGLFTLTTKTTQLTLRWWRS